MGNNNQTCSTLQRFEHNEHKTRLLVFGFCRSIVGTDHFAEHQLLDLNLISTLIKQHYDYAINSSIRSLSKYLAAKRNSVHSHCLTDDYYLWISFEIAQMLIESHHGIREHFNGAIKPKALLSLLQQADAAESKESDQDNEDSLHQHQAQTQTQDDDDEDKENEEEKEPDSPRTHSNHNNHTLIGPAYSPSEPPTPPPSLPLSSASPPNSNHAHSGSSSRSSTAFKRLDRYLLAEQRLAAVPIASMDFGRKTYGVSKAQSAATYPATTVDDYVFEITGDPSSIYNGRYKRCIYIVHTCINDNGEVSCSSFKKHPYKLHFGDHLNVWVHEDDLTENPALPKSASSRLMEHDDEDMLKVPNKQYKYIRCLTRNQYNHLHCYWRLHCLKINNKGKLQSSLSRFKHISERNLDEDDNDCIQYLGVVHQWTSRNGGHLSKNELLPQYYEYPCSKSTIWRKIEGVSFISAHIALFSNEFCSRLPSLNNVGRNSNTVKCRLVKAKTSIFWNAKCLRNIEKNIDCKHNWNEAKYVYYLVSVWLNQLIYKVALDHGFNFKRLDGSYASPHLYYKYNWNPLSKYLQIALFNARIKYHGKDIYFKDIESGFGGSHSHHHSATLVNIAEEHSVASTVESLLQCLRVRLQNKHKHDTVWLRQLNEIQLAPAYKQGNAKLLKK